jgi:hypothetical protein
MGGQVSDDVEGCALPCTTMLGRECKESNKLGETHILCSHLFLNSLGRSVPLRGRFVRCKVVAPSILVSIPKEKGRTGG